MNKRRMIILLLAAVMLFTVPAFAAEYEYDELNRLVKVTYEDGSSVSYQYDDNGNLTATTVSGTPPGGGESDAEQPPAPPAELPTEPLIQVIAVDLSTVTIPFTDVQENSYYYDAVKWAYACNITDGKSPESFDPGGDCTRAEIVTFLWKAAGCPEPEMTDNPFDDVDLNSFYGKAVLWALEHEITTGISPTEFSPSSTVNRGQAITFLYRASGKTEAGAVSAFDDVSEDSYYYQAVNWACANDVTNGVGDGMFAPDELCLRGQTVTFLFRAFAE